MLLIIKTTKRKGAEEAARKQREGRRGGIAATGGPLLNKLPDQFPLVSHV